MEYSALDIEGLVLFKPRKFQDNRGFFTETFRQNIFDEAVGGEQVFVQDNHSVSATVNTVRGLHFQAPPHAQDKLVRCGQGVLFDVAVDIRNGSATYGQWFGIELSAENGKQLLVPKGFLHGFSTRAPNTEIIYKCTDYYNQPSDGAVRFDDPGIGIDWGLSGDAVLSDKDSAAPVLADFNSPFEYQGEPS